MSGELSPTGEGSPELRVSHTDRDRVVEVLRVAAGDGMLTADELDGRLEKALAARTGSDLAALTADLPPRLATVGEAQAKDVVRIEQTHSSPIVRAGRWVLPRRLEIATQWCDVTLDLTQAVITEDTLRVDVDMTGKTLTLITRPGVVVDVDDLRLVHGRLTQRAPHDLDAPVVLRVVMAGRKTHGRVVVRPPRRTLTQWLLRR